MVSSCGATTPDVQVRANPYPACCSRLVTSPDHSRKRVQSRWGRHPIRAAPSRSFVPLKPDIAIVLGCEHRPPRRSASAALGGPARASCAAPAPFLHPVSQKPVKAPGSNVARSAAKTVSSTEISRQRSSLCWMPAAKRSYLTAAGDDIDEPGRVSSAVVRGLR